jgi:hypothetical protein
MTRYSVTSNLGMLFKIVIYVLGVGYVAFFVYSFTEHEMSTQITVFLILLFYYFYFFRRVFRMKEVFFDQEKIYFEGKEVLLKDIVLISPKSIVYEDGEELNEVYYNYYFTPNIDLLKALHTNTIKN